MRLKQLFMVLSLGMAGSAHGYDFSKPKDSVESAFASLNWDYKDYRRFGDLMQYGVPLLALAVSESKNDRDGSVRLLESCAVSVGTVHLLKRAFNKTILSERPTGSDLSFPSGHTIGAVCGASYLHSRYGGKYGLGGFFLASHVGGSRAYRGQNDPETPHHVRDVFVSMLIGYAVSEWMVKPYDVDKKPTPGIYGFDMMHSTPLFEYSTRIKGYGMKRQDPFDMNLQVTRTRFSNGQTDYGFQAQLEYRF